MPNTEGRPAESHLHDPSLGEFLLSGSIPARERDIRVNLSSCSTDAVLGLIWLEWDWESSHVNGLNANNRARHWDKYTLEWPTSLPYPYPSVSPYLTCQLGKQPLYLNPVFNNYIPSTGFPISTQDQNKCSKNLAN